MYIDILKQLKQINVITSNGVNPKYKVILEKHLPLLLSITEATDFLQTTSIREMLYAIINNITSKPLCKYCNIQPVKFIKDGKYRNTYEDYCSLKCSHSTIQTKEKRCATVREKYGVDNISQLSEIQQKKVVTSLQKYGTEYPWQYLDIKIKKEQQLLEKYNVINVMKLDWVKEKLNQTNVERYGTHPSRTLSVKNKMKQTTIERYGVSNFNQQHISTDVLEKLNNKEWLYTQHITEQRPLINIAKKLNISDGTVGKYLHLYGYDTVRFPTSQAEKEIGQFLEDQGISNIITNTRSIISPLELDIYLPDYNIAIEYCGVYWHSHFHKPNNYHLNKLIQCNKKSIRLLTIFEDEWIHKQDIVKQKLLSILKKDNRSTIFARKATIITLNAQQKNEFFELNHIQGTGPGSITYGLMYNEEIIAAMTFIVQKNNHYILNRYATACHIPGGFSKLLKYFQSNNIWNTIVSFADLRWSNGNLYKITGWTLDKILPPDYSYVIGNQRVHKFNYRRKNLPDLLEQYNPSLSETQNTTMNGIPRIYNCGLQRYILRNNKT